MAAWRGRPRKAGHDARRLQKRPALQPFCFIGRNLRKKGRADALGREPIKSGGVVGRPLWSAPDSSRTSREVRKAPIFAVQRGRAASPKRTYIAGRGQLGR
jgi:hypothetical protein